MKKKRAKRIVALVLSFAMIFSLSGMTVLADEMPDMPPGGEGGMAGVTGDGAPEEAAIYVAGGVVTENAEYTGGVYTADISTTDDGTVNINNLKMTGSTYDYTGVVVTDAEDDTVSKVNINNAEITLNVDTAYTDESAGVAVAVDGASELYINDSEITVNGAGRYTIAAYSTSTMVVNNSSIVAGGSKAANGNTDSVSDPMSNATLLVSGTSRSNFSIGASNTYYYGSECIAEGWAALSTDSATGDGLDLVAYNTYAEATNGGYGTYADTNCRDYLYGVTFNAAEVGAIISNNGSIYIGSGADAADDIVDGISVMAYAADDYTVNNEGSVIYAERNAVQMHSPDMMGEGTAGYQAELTVENSTLTTVATDTLKATSTKNYYDYGDAVGAYVDYVTGSVLLIKSTGAKIDLTNVEMESSNGILIHSIINSDSMSRFIKAGNEGNDVEVSMTDMDVEGDIVHDDYQRDMIVTLSNTKLDGAVTTATADSWYLQWAEYADDEATYWTTIDTEEYNTETHATEINLTNGSVWTASDLSYVTKLTIDETSSVVYYTAYDATGTEIKLEAGNTYEDIYIVGADIAVLDGEFTVSENTTYEHGVVITEGNL